MKSKTLSLEILEKKMYGGWVGKNIGGTLGGPLEGTMELLNVEFYTQVFNGPMENDDLDLQLVSLHAIEQYGARITSKHLSEEWRAHVYFAYDEYGHALTNMRRGIRSPLAGRYNNFFANCMGSPIRSEIWAMLAAGYPDLATYYAYQDALVDHAGGEGVYGEIFFAAFESMAFYEDDMMVLLEKSLEYVPETCQTAKAVRTVMTLYQQGVEWKAVRQSIIDQYATENFTYAPPNIAFTVLALLYGKDFSDAICIATSCGYDTDCTAATVGAMLGILEGIEAIPEKWIKPIGDKIEVSTPVMGFDAPQTLKELTERTMKAREIVLAEYQNSRDLSVFQIDYELDTLKYLLPEGSFGQGDLRVSLSYEGQTPTIGRDGKKEIKIIIENLMPCLYKGVIRWQTPLGFGHSDDIKFELQPGAKGEYTGWVTQGGEQKWQYPCELVIEKYNYDLLWTTYQVPFTLLPTMEWLVKREGDEKWLKIECETNRIDFEKALEIQKGEKYEAKTQLEIPTDRKIDLVVSTYFGVEVNLDGESIIQCEAHTPFIPAYHRSEEKKRKEMYLKQGSYTLEIIVDKDDESSLDVCFMPVQPYPKVKYVDGFFGYYVDVLMHV